MAKKDNIEIGSNFINHKGQQMVVSDIKTIGENSIYELINESGQKLSYSIADMKGLNAYTGERTMNPKSAKQYADKWNELKTLKNEFYKNLQDNPNWSIDDQVRFFKDKIDPVVKSLNSYKGSMTKRLGRQVHFDDSDAHYYMDNFVKKERQRLKNSMPGKSQYETNNVNTENTIKTNEVEAKSNLSPDDYFKNLNGSPEDIFNNFDNHFGEYLRNNPGMSGAEQIEIYNNLKEKYKQEAEAAKLERVAQEREQAKQQEIEQYRREGKYDNGQAKVSEEVLDDGRHVKYYHNEDGSVHKQVITNENGDKDISFRRTEAEIGDDPQARKMISKKRVIKEGNKIIISETPDSTHTSRKTIDLDNKTITIEEIERSGPWSGGKKTYDSVTMSLDDYYEHRKKELFPDKDQKLNNNFRGGNPKNRTEQQKLVDNIIGKQNPGGKTSRVFDYNGKEYAIYDNLEINAKDLSKGITGGKVVDLETNKLVEAREAFANINQALMDGDINTALNELQSFKESEHTFAKSELDKKIVNKHTDDANQQNKNHQEAKNEQQNRNQKQHEEQEEDFDESRTEQSQETNDNHKENHQKSTDTDVPDNDTNKPRTRGNDIDPNLDPDTKVRTRKQKLERTKGKKIVPGKTKVNSNLRVSKNVKGKDLNQILINTFINKALDTVDDTLDNTININTNTNKINWQKSNIVHPDKMDDFQIAELTDDEIKMFANGNQEKIDEWTQRRNKAQANKVLNHYMDNSQSSYNNSEYKNPYQYDVPEMNFEVDENGEVKINKTGNKRTVEVEDNKSFKRQKAEQMNRIMNGSGNSLDDVLDWMKNHKLGVLDIGMNIYGTISTYKEARRKGHGVVSSTVRAAANFAVFEMLGPLASFGVNIARTLPSMAIKGVDLLYKENRKMNSAANNQVFGDAQFYDTQQLATMRQSGMEMAKMAQYNLQQTLMGNEATYLHR